MDRKQIVHDTYNSISHLSMNNTDYNTRVTRFLERKFASDLGTHGDITTQATVPLGITATATIYAKQPGIVAGVEEVTAFYTAHNVVPTPLVSDGTAVVSQQEILTLSGTFEDLLKTERVGLNFLQMMSGIATHTAQYVAALEGFDTYVAATRKEWADEHIEKKGVIVGGGLTHRIGLDGFIMIKDNHLAARKKSGDSNPIWGALYGAYNCPHTSAVEVEVTTKDEAVHAAAFFRQEGGLSGKKVPIIMLDNMSPQSVAEVVPLIRDVALVEASGNISLDTIAAYAAAGVDIVSTSKLNRDAPALDLSQRINF